MVLNLGFFKLGSKKDPAVRIIYDRLVAQARLPVFYQDYDVPDSLSGRFDMIVLHSFLFFYRIKNEDDEVKSFGQRVFDTFIEDMDRSLREMGVGYQAVPKRMKKMGEAFYGRMSAYDGAVESNNEMALVDVLYRNIFPDTEAMPAKIRHLADYTLANVKALHSSAITELYNDIPFLDPADSLKGGQHD